MNRKAVFGAVLAVGVILAGCSTAQPAASPSTSTTEAASSTIASSTAVASSTTVETPAQASGVGQVSDLAELAAKICYGPPIAGGEVAVVYGYPNEQTSPIASDPLLCIFYDHTVESNNTRLDLTLFNPPYTSAEYWEFYPLSPEGLAEARAQTIEGPNWMVGVQTGSSITVDKVRAILTH